MQVVLPDNLTTWRMTAKAVTADTLVGESKQDIISTKDLLDPSRHAALFRRRRQIHRRGGRQQQHRPRRSTWTCGSKAQGVTIAGQAAQKVTVPANDKVRVEWQVEVQDAQSANLVFSVSGGGLSRREQADRRACRPTSASRSIATRRPRPSPRRARSTKPVSGWKSSRCPAKVDTTQGDLTVRIDPSLAAGMTDGLTWLEHYPYECAEQTVSRFLPNVLTFRALKKLNLTSPSWKTISRSRSASACSGCTASSTPMAAGAGGSTTRAARRRRRGRRSAGQGARKAGFAVDAHSLKRALDYLDAQLVSPTTLKEASQANMQAFILYVRPKRAATT